MEPVEPSSTTSRRALRRTGHAAILPDYAGAVTTTSTTRPSDHRATGGPGLPQERRLVTEIPGPRSQEKFARRGQHVAKGVGTTLPVFVEAAGGGVLVDADGNSLIDLAARASRSPASATPPRTSWSGWSQQVRAFTHTCFMVTPYDGYVDVCEQLAELTPGDHAKKSALFNSGAEAVENAVKVARAHTGRDAVAVVDHAYHGRTNLTMAMTVEVDALQARLRARSPARSTARRCPTRSASRRRSAARPGRRPRHRRAREAGRRRRTWPAW